MCGEIDRRGMRRAEAYGVASWEGEIAMSEQDSSHTRGLASQESSRLTD